MSVEGQGQANSASFGGREFAESVVVAGVSTLLMLVLAFGALALSGGWWPW
jgi:hypothetical protein